MNIYSTIVEENFSWDGIAVYDKAVAYSYPQLFSDVDHVANSLLEAGVKPLDRCVLLQMIHTNISYIVWRY